METGGSADHDGTIFFGFLMQKKGMSQNFSPLGPILAKIFDFESQGGQ
jgi:hypothetical protein